MPIGQRYVVGLNENGKSSVVMTGLSNVQEKEDAFWRALKDIAFSRQLTISEMVAIIDAGRAQGNLSSAIRLFVLAHYRALVEPAAGRTARGIVADIE